MNAVHHSPSPIPGLPTPDLPTPDLPTPDLPTRDLPIPGLPMPVAAPASDAVPAERHDSRGDVLVVMPLWDPVVEEIGFHPRSEYVEQFWLPVLGPSATWLLRRLADGLDAAPAGFEVTLSELAGSLGLGGAVGRRSALHRALGRCVRFGTARFGTARSAMAAPTSTVAVRRMVAPLSNRHLLGLPSSLQELHRAWEQRRQTTSVGDALHRRARLLALDLVQLGEGRQAIERHLARWGVHPALAHEATNWAHSAHRAPHPPPAAP